MYGAIERKLYGEIFHDLALQQEPKIVEAPVLGPCLQVRAQPSQVGGTHCNWTQRRKKGLSRLRGTSRQGTASPRKLLGHADTPFPLGLVEEWIIGSCR